jgi:transmembrane sensor
VKSNREQQSTRATASEWLLRSLSPDFSNREKEQLDAWLNESKENQQLFEELQSHWNALEALKFTAFPERNAALLYRPKNNPSLWLTCAAATILLVTGLTALMPNGWLGTSRTYQVEKGSRQSIDLPDGSMMELNTDSEARIRFNYWQRSVELIKGEAFFTVEHNPERPFEVQAAGGRIRDTGTAFNVYIASNEVLVAVAEGQVEVLGAEKRLLGAGKQLAYNRNGEILMITATDTESLAAWRRGQWVFHNRRLEEVLIEIGRYHDTTIRLENNALADLHVSGTFKTSKLYDALNAITEILPVKIDFAGNKEIVLKEASRRSH